MKFKPRLLYGVVYNNTFISDNANFKLVGEWDTGLYQLNITADDPGSTLEPADLIEFEKYVKASKKMRFVSGLTFKNAIIPFNHIEWNKKGFSNIIPVINLHAEPWSIVKVVSIPYRKVFFYWEDHFGPLQMTLTTIYTAYMSNHSLEDMVGVTPEMRILMTLHGFEKLRIEKELAIKRKEDFLKTLSGRLQTIVISAGGTFKSYEEMSGGRIVVIWELDSKIYNTVVSKDFRVIEAGICVSGGDTTQSLGSLVNLVQQYNADGDYYSIIRT